MEVLILLMGQLSMNWYFFHGKLGGITLRSEMWDVLANVCSPIGAENL